MKNLLFTLALTIGLSVFAQENTEIINPKFSCDAMVVNKETNTTAFIGNANFKTDIIEVTNADKIVFNKETNEIIVTGLKQYNMVGSIQVIKDSPKNTLRYTLGERIAYVE